MSKINKFNEYSQNLSNGFTEEIFIQYLKEGLIKTYPIEYAVRYLTKAIRTNATHFVVDCQDETIFIKLTKSKTSVVDIRFIINTLNTCGYFPSLFILYDINDQIINNIKYIKTKNSDNIEDIFNNDFHMIQVEAEAKFNLPLNVPAKLYHVTNSRYLDKILKIGLIPKSKNKRVHHPDRIYFGYTEIGCRNLILQFNKDASDNNKPIQKWSVLEIDTYSLDLTIYTDPDYYDGCWTSDNIPPVKIKVLN